MYISVYIYVKHDMDIYPILENGYPLGTIIRDALIGFANGYPIKIYLDKPLLFDMNKSKKGARVSVTIPEIEINTINMLKSVKPGYLSNFCKTILRNCIVQQNIGCYFEENLFSEQQITDMLSMNLVYNLDDIKNLRTISTYPKTTNKSTKLKKKQYPNIQNNSVQNTKNSTPFSEIFEHAETGTTNVSEQSLSSAKQKAHDFQKRTLAPSLQAGIDTNDNTITTPTQEAIEPITMSSSVPKPLPQEKNVLQSETHSTRIPVQKPEIHEKQPVTSVHIDDIDDDTDEYITNIDNDKPITVATGADNLFDFF